MSVTIRLSHVIWVYDSPLSCHLGITKTYDRVRQRYWFPHLRKRVIYYVKACHECQVRKLKKSKPLGKMQFFPTPEQPFERVQIDFTGPFPVSSKQNKLLISAVDYLTRWVELRAVRHATTETLVQFFIEQIICRHDVPKIFQSDNGTIFTSDFFQTFTQRLGIKHQLGTAYHPASQGCVERSHSVIND